MSQSSTKNTTISSRLAAYSTVAAATTAAAGAVNAAEIVHDIADVTLDSSGFGMLFNMLTGSTSDCTSSSDCLTSALGVFHLQPRFNGYIYGPTAASVGQLGFRGKLESYSTSYSTSGGAVVVNTYELAVARPGTTSDSISGSEYFVASGPSSSRYYAYLGFADGQTGVVGIRFELPTGVHYGWAQITRIDEDNFTLHGFGYNNTPGAASAPVDTVVPEPGSLALLALGAAGLASRRKRKQVA